MNFPNRPPFFVAIFENVREGGRGTKSVFEFEVHSFERARLWVRV